VAPGERHEQDSSAACWLDEVCPECGAIAEHRDGCSLREATDA
jgi:hypothetical protein